MVFEDVALALEDVAHLMQFCLVSGTWSIHWRDCGMVFVGVSVKCTSFSSLFFQNIVNGCLMGRLRGCVVAVQRIS